MVDVKEYFGKSGLTVSDFAALPVNQRVFVIVGNARFETFPARKPGESPDNKLVLDVEFQGQRRHWVVSKTNAEFISKRLSSTNTDDWTGVIVEVDINTKGINPYVVVVSAYKKGAVYR